jgi:hypothetical protein
MLVPFEIGIVHQKWTEGKSHLAAIRSRMRTTEAHLYLVAN